MSEFILENAPQDLELVSLKLFFYISAEWGLDDIQRSCLLGIESREKIKELERALIQRDDVPILSLDQLHRISCLIKIFKAIGMLFDDLTVRRGYVHQTHRDFSDQSILDVMLNGELSDFNKVCRYLEANCQSNFL